MVMVEKEQQLKMRMEHIRFGKEELERRRKSPVHTNRPCMESTCYIHTEQGEPADYE
jgi:hypothetical protein